MTDSKETDVEPSSYNSMRKYRSAVGCVIVTYLPDREKLIRQLEAISQQVDSITVVDNGDGSTLPEFDLNAALHFIFLGDNFGIARAQNVGISHARQKGADVILLLDQDSLPAANMVGELVRGLNRLQNDGIAVAAVGPQHQDALHNNPFPFKYREGITLKDRDVAQAAVPADFLIASGCLIPVNTLDTVGTMDETLFIDYVDIEWCLRARGLGHSCYGVPAAQMEHSLGDRWIVFKGKNFPVHSPVRYYYYIRNSVFLARERWIGWPWRIILIRRVVKQFVFLGFILPGRRAENLANMALGLWHGVIGRRGKR